MKPFTEQFLLQDVVVINAAAEKKNILVFLDVANTEGYIRTLGVKDKIQAVPQFICFACGSFPNQVLQ